MAINQYIMQKANESGDCGRAGPAPPWCGFGCRAAEGGPGHRQAASAARLCLRIRVVVARAPAVPFRFPFPPRTASLKPREGGRASLLPANILRVSLHCGSGTPHNRAPNGRGNSRTSRHREVGMFFAAHPLDCCAKDGEGSNGGSVATQLTAHQLMLATEVVLEHAGAKLPVVPLGGPVPVVRRPVVPVVVQRRVARLLEPVQPERLAPGPPRQTPLGPIVEGCEDRADARRDPGAVHPTVHHAARRDRQAREQLDGSGGLAAVCRQKDKVRPPL